MTQDVDQAVFGTPEDASAPVQQAQQDQSAAQPQQSESAPASVFGDLSDATGFETAPLGETRSKFPIEQFKGAKGRLDIISLLSTQVVIVKTHYDEGEGGFKRFYCLTPESSVCCQHHGPPSVHYILPIVVYDSVVSTVDGRPQIDFAPKGKMRVGYLKVVREKYDFFRDVQMAGQDPSMFDYNVSCADSKFQDLKFTKREGQARWRQNQQVAQALRRRFNEVAYAIRPAVAKTITVEEFLAKHGQAPATQQQAPGFQLGDITG